MASAEGPRSAAGETAAMAFNSVGALPPQSPAIFSTRLPPMQNDHRCMLFRVRLPVAMAQHLHSFFHLEELFLGRRQFIGAGKEIADKRLRMSVAQKPPRHKRVERLILWKLRHKDGKRWLI